MHRLSRTLHTASAVLVVGLLAAPALAATADFPASMTAPDGRTSLTRLATGDAPAPAPAYAEALYAERPAHDLASLRRAGPALLLFHPTGEAGANALRSDVRHVYETYCSHTVCEHIGRGELQRLIDAIHADQDTAFLVDAKGVTVSQSGTVTTQIADPAFGQHILTANFGPSSPTSSLKTGLMQNPG